MNEPDRLHAIETTSEDSTFSCPRIPEGIEVRQGPHISRPGTPMSAARLKHSLIHKSAQYEHEGEHDSAVWLAHRSHVIVFTYSGKPVYTRYGSEDLIAGFTGTLQALMAKVAVLGLSSSGNDQLKTITFGRLRVVFLDRSPLILVSICKQKDVPTESNFRLLKAVHAQVIFILTGSINTTLTERANFDVRSLLGGTKPLMVNLISWMHRDMLLAIEDSAVEALPLPYPTRLALTTVLQVHTPDCCALALLLSGHRVIATAAPRTAYPLVSACDMILLINLVVSSTSLRSGEGWTPVCLPSVSQEAFVYAYVHFLTEEIAYVCLSLSPESENFYAISRQSQLIQESLQTGPPIAGVVSEWAAKCPLSLSSLPGEDAADERQDFLLNVRHCAIVLNHSRQLFSSKMVSPEPLFSDEEAPSFKRIYRNYAQALATLRSGGSSSKQVSMTTENSFVFVWITTEFQFFLTTSKGVDMAIITYVYQWIRDREQTLFMPNIPNSADSGTRLNVSAPSLW